jgi:hypothetical protein
MHNEQGLGTVPLKQQSLQGDMSIPIMERLVHVGLEMINAIEE